MKKLSIKLLGVVLISATLSSAITPAFALGGCGPNRHRNGWGECVWGGQNQDWCLRTNRPSGHARSQWDIALLSLRLALTQSASPNTVDFGSRGPDFRVCEGLRAPAD